jgi:hypothetical protein
MLCGLAGVGTAAAARSVDLFIGLEKTVLAAD